MSASLVFAVPKGRIGEELGPLLSRVGVVPESAFHDSSSRKLRFNTNEPGLEMIRVRAFDAATFVAHGAAHMGVVGNDVLAEFDYAELYSPLDLGIGACRLSLCRPVQGLWHDPQRTGVLRAATKYPRVTARFYAARGISADVVPLSGAMEIAPALQLAPAIVDLVATGGTLRANGLMEAETLLTVTSRLIVNRAAYKTLPQVRAWISRFSQALQQPVGESTPRPAAKPTGGNWRLRQVKLDERSVVRRQAEVEHELSLARADLLHNSHFVPVGYEPDGPFTLTLRLEEDRVWLNIGGPEDQPLTECLVPMRDFRNIIREYFMVCESYYDAIRNGAGPAQIETLDMGRRGVHNQGSELLMEVLGGHVQMDLPTARRLFTLMCVLHVRG